MRVGGHHRRNGRFCRAAAGTAAAPHPKASGLQVAAGRLPAHPGGLFDAPERPAESPQRQNLLSFLVSQDVAHAAQERRVPRRRQRLGPLSEMAGFQLSINGRFWVSTEVGDLERLLSALPVELLNWSDAATRKRGRHP